MKILLVAATPGEIAPLVARAGRGAVRALSSRVTEYELAGHRVTTLVSGVGMVATAAWCSRVLAAGDYPIALNVGVCGSFDARLSPGTVVHIVSDRIAELGAEDGERFLTLEALKLSDDTAEVVNANPPRNDVLSALPKVTGITVNTVHGRDESIVAVVDRFHPQVESMEGAAFMYACSIHGVPSAQVRAVSNIVERRNRGAWRMTEAIENLADTTLKILEAM
jgi:futalosine hydrolase